MYQIPRIAVFAFLIVAVLVSAPATEAKRSPGPVVLVSPDESEPSLRQGDQRLSLRTGTPLAL